MRTLSLWCRTIVVIFDLEETAYTSIPIIDKALVDHPRVPYSFHHIITAKKCSSLRGLLLSQNCYACWRYIKRKKKQYRLRPFFVVAWCSFSESDSSMLQPVHRSQPTFSKPIGLKLHMPNI